MKKLMQYITLVSGITVLCLFGINFIVERSLKKQTEDVYGKLNEIFEGKENFDLLFVGSSRVLVQINPMVIDTILSINSFNAGLDGISIVECKMVIESYLDKHQAPQALVLNMDMGSMEITDTYQEFDYPLFLPYLNHKYVKQTLYEYTPSVKFLGCFPFLKPAYYNDFKKYLALKAIAHLKQSKKNILYKGYAPKDRAWRGQNIQSHYKPAYSITGISLFKDILNICNQHKIIPIVVYAPQTEELTNSTDNFSLYKNFLKEICQNYKGYFLDYSTIPITKNKKYFYNHLHLNDKGADIYSTLMANDLKLMVKN